MKQIRIPSVQLLEFHRKYFSKPWFSLAALSNGNRKNSYVHIRFSKYFCVDLTSHGKVNLEMSIGGHIVLSSCPNSSQIMHFILRGNSSALV